MKLVTNLTVVYFEYPAAKHDIESWSERMKDQIVEKNEYPRNIVSYSLSKGETVVCIPINEAHIIFEFDLSLYNYKKTLIFGKVEVNDLALIQSNIIKLKNLCTPK